MSNIPQPPQPEKTQTVSAVNVVAPAAPVPPLPEAGKVPESTVSGMQTAPIASPPPNIQNTQSQGSDGPGCAKIVLIAVGVIITVFIIGGIILSLVVRSSFEGARKKAQQDAFKASVSSTAPAVIICKDDNGRIYSPENDGSLCSNDSTSTWPDLSQYDGAQWGGCDFINNVQEETFQYCAQMDELLFYCTQVGCTEADPNSDAITSGVENAANTVATIIEQDRQRTDSSTAPVQKNTQGLQEGSLANQQLIQDTLQGVVGKLAVLGCSRYESHQAYVLESPTFTEGNISRWQERWIVVGCGNTYPIDISFVETPGQGTVWSMEGDAPSATTPTVQDDVSVGNTTVDNQLVDLSPLPQTTTLEDFARTVEAELMLIQEDLTVALEAAERGDFTKAAVHSSKALYRSDERIDDIIDEHDFEIEEFDVRRSVHRMMTDTDLLIDEMNDLMEETRDGDDFRSPSLLDSRIKSAQEEYQNNFIKDQKGFIDGYDFMPILDAGKRLRTMSHVFTR